MAGELPRFNPQFVNALPSDGPEREFVSNVGDVTFLMRSHTSVLSEIDFRLRRPFLTGQFRSQTVFDEHVEDFGSNFENELEERGLGEIILALNGLKVATDQLRGRTMHWAMSDFKPNDVPEYDSGFLVGSQIGFHYGAPITPALFVELAPEASDAKGVHMYLGMMWDIKIDPQV